MTCCTSSRTFVSPLLAFVALLLPSYAQGPGQVAYKGSSYQPDDLPEAAPQALREMVALHAPLIESLKLRGYLGSRGDFGLFYSGKIPSAKAIQGRADKVTDFFEKVWGHSEDREPYAVFLFDDPEHVGAFLDNVVPKFPYLESWAPSAKKSSGFNLYQPPCYVILDQTGPKTEFKLENTLVHQQTLLILYREFRSLPFWLKEGLAWLAEDSLTKKIYHFNYREGFVGVKEHAGWPKEAKALAKTNGDFKRVFTTSPDTYQRELSLLAFGFARFLAKQDKEKVRALLTALGEAQAKKSGEGKDPNVELSAEEQDRILAEHLGADYAEQVISFLRK